jgi:hypothetical protein
VRERETRIFVVITITGYLPHTDSFLRRVLKTQNSKASQIIKAREPNMQIFVKTVSMRASSSSLFASDRVV